MRENNQAHHSRFPSSLREPWSLCRLQCLISCLPYLEDFPYYKGFKPLHSCTAISYNILKRFEEKVSPFLMQVDFEKEIIKAVHYLIQVEIKKLVTFVCHE